MYFSSHTLYHEAIIQNIMFILFFIRMKIYKNKSLYTHKTVLANNHFSKVANKKLIFTS